MTTILNRSRFLALLLPAVMLVAAPQMPPAPSQAPPPPPQAPPAPPSDDTYQGEPSERYAMVRTIEGEVHIRKGDLDEALTRGTPVAEGDVVESRGRGVLQLGDGTRVAFGGATRLTVAALFTDRRGEKQVLLRLDYGRVRVLLGGQSDARLRVDTPSGSATCFDKGSFTLEAEPDHVVRLRVHTGRVTFTNDRDEARITAGERLTVYSPLDGLDRVRAFNTFEGDDFDRWSERAIVIRRGESWDRVPSEIRYYANDLDDHGRWVHSDEFGWVWQPNGVAEDWRPYSDGRWAPYAGGMTWISNEPWAYVGYHYGRWNWGVGLGWCWIPGVYYSPAWVAWNYTPGYCGWAPLGYYNTPCRWGYGAWGGGYAWNVVSVTQINVVNVHNHIYSDANTLHSFNGATTWNGGGRDLHAPWQRSPLMVSQAEFRNPGQIQSAFQRDVHRERMNAYERQAQAATGRVIVRQPVPPANPGGIRPPSNAPGSSRIPFEDHGRSQPADRTVPREPGPAPRPRTEDRRPEPVPQRSPETRPRTEDRRPEPVPQRSPETRPRTEDRRPEPVPQRSPETRPRTEDRRTVDSVVRGRSNDPQPERRSEPQPRPAPKSEAPKERPKEERR